MLGGRYAKDVFGFKMGNCVELNISVHLSFTARRRVTRFVGAEI